MQAQATSLSQRLFSLDVFRGLTMFLLIAEAAGFHHNFTELTEGTAFSGLAEQLHHHPWNGLRFWDLIQPFFMFIVGVAMPFLQENDWPQEAAVPPRGIFSKDAFCCSPLGSCFIVFITMP